MEYTEPLAVDDDAITAGEEANEGLISERARRTKSLCIVASIRNLAQIENAYGTATALAVRHSMYERAREFCTREYAMMTCSGDQILFLMDRALPADLVNDQVDPSGHSIVEAVVASLGDATVIASS